MEISAEKTKLMTSSANGIQREIRVKRQTLGSVTTFNFLRAVVSDDGSKPEVLSRIAEATAALTKLKPIWRDNNISLVSKVKVGRKTPRNWLNEVQDLTQDTSWEKEQHKKTPS